MNNILALALLTFKDGLRQRVLYGAIVFSLLVIFVSILISGMFMRQITKVTLDFCLSAVNIGGLLVPVFLAVHLLARDIERRTIFSILSRAISRKEYLLGKFGGLTLLTGAIMAVLACATAVALMISKLIYAEYFFAELSWSSILLSICVSFLGMTVLNAMVILWSTLTTSSFLATLLTVGTYLIGQSVEDMVRFISTRTPGVEISPVVEHTVRAASYLFPNLAAFDLKLLAAHGLVIPGRELLFLLVYAVAYTTAALTLAMVSFQRRDLT